MIDSAFFDCVLSLVSDLASLHDQTHCGFMGKKMLKKLPSMCLFTAYQLNHILTIPCLQCLHIWFSRLVQLSQALKGHWITYAAFKTLFVKDSV